GETVEATESFWRDPDRLRYAAARLHAKAAEPSRFMPEYDPPQRNVSRLMTGYAPDDPETAEERERDFRAMRAKQEIMNALAEQERQAKQQQEKERADARAKLRQTALGQLLGRII